MATKGFNTAIDYGNQSTAAASTMWTSFASVVEIKPPGLKSEDIETTVLTSPNEMKEWLPGLGDAGESTFKVKWNAAQTTTVYSLFRQPKGMRVVYADAPYPSGSKLAFDGWISGIENEQIQKDNTVEAQITVRVTGLPTFTAMGS
jgi:hypothetical protein